MPVEPDRIHFVADRGDARLRLDQAVVRHLHAVRVSRTRVQQWIGRGCVAVDGAVASRPGATLREGSSVVVSLPPDAERRQRPAPEPLALSIVYQDDALLVVDKPPGLVVHPSYRQASGTLLNGVLAHLQGARVEPGIVTRLDKQTSGLVAIAIAAGIHRIVQRDAAAGLVQKEYLAVVSGVVHPPRATIRQPLMRALADRRRMIASPRGATAVTRYEVLATARGQSLLRCELVTGRTHQIRAHLAERGWPLLGDAVYGSRHALLGTRQALHAWRLTLPHPLTRQPLVLKAPPPSDLRAAAPDLFDRR